MLDGTFSIVNQLPVAVFIIDVNHKVMYWNQMCERLTGVPEEEIIGTSNHSFAFYGFFRPVLVDLIIDNRSKIPEYYHTHEELDDWYSGQAMLSLPTGEKHFYFRAKPIYQGAKLVGALEVLVDVTEQKYTEEFNENLYTNSNEGIIVFGKEDKSFRFINKTMLDFIGCKNDQADLPELEDRLHKYPELLRFREQLISKLLEDTQKVVRIQFYREPEDFIFLSGKVRSVKYFGEEAILINLSDITEAVRAEEEKNKTYEGLLKVLARTIDYRDHYTERHSDRVKEYAAKLAKKLSLPFEQQEEIRVGSMFHDLGKIGIPDHIINKKGLLTSEEYAIIKEHPLIGYRIIEPVIYSTNLKAMILFHHERWDGKGYPLGIKGDEIPLVARIVAIADAFDAMTSNRVYRKPMTVSEALQEIRDCSGTQFDPKLAMIFVQMVEEELRQNEGIA